MVHVCVCARVRVPLKAGEVGGWREGVFILKVEERGAFIPETTFSQGFPNVQGEVVNS